MPVFGFWFWFWVVVALGALVAAVLIVRRRRYVGKVKALGWTLEPNPSLTRVADLNAPPFGLGFRRSVDELVSGTTASGHAFRVFEYDYSGAGRGYSERLACVQLPFGLPDVFVTDSEHARTGISPAGVPLVQAEEGTLRAIAADGSLASQVLVLIAPVIAGAPALAEQVDLSIDGDQLVVGGAPKDPDELQAFLAALDPIASALSDTALRGHEVAPAADRFGFYGHPDWQFGPDGNQVLDYYPVTTGGYGAPGHRPDHGPARRHPDGCVRPTSGRPIAPRPTPTPRATPTPGRSPTTTPSRCAASCCPSTCPAFPSTVAGWARRSPSRVPTSTARSRCGQRTPSSPPT